MLTEIVRNGGFHNFFILIANVIGIWLFVNVLLSDYKKVVNRLFGLMVFSMLGWMDFAFLARFPESEAESVIYLKIAWLVTPIFFLTIYFYSLYLFQVQKRFYIITNINIVICTFFALLTGFSDLVIAGRFYRYGNLAINYGVGMWPYMIGVAFILFTTIYALFIGNKTISKDRFLSLRPYLIGVVIFYSLNLVFNISLPIFFGVSRYYYFGDYSTLVLTSLVAYSIVRYNFMGVKMLFITFIVNLIGILLLIDTIVLSDNTFEIVVTSFIFLIFLCLAYLLIRGVLAEIEQQRVLETKNSELNIIQKITNEIISTLDPREVAQRAVDSLSRDMNYFGAILFIYDKKKNVLKVNAKSKTLYDIQIEKILGESFENIELDLNDKHIQELSIYKAFKTNSPVSTNQWVNCVSRYTWRKTFDSISELIRFGSLNSFPIRIRDQVVGVVSYVLTDKKPEELTQDDKNLMSTFVNQISIGLENARLFKVYQELTDELGKKNRELADYAQKEKDILDIMGHELRTPITIVRNSLSLLVKGIEMNTLPQEKINHYLDVAYRSVKREMAIIETMLQATKVESNKIELVREEVKPLEVIADAIEGQKENAKNKQLELIFVPAGSLPNVYADRTRIQQILDNFLSNAVKYTEKGTVTINVTVEGDFVKFAVTDTGYGISEESQEKLGTKFYRVAQHTSDEESRLYHVVRPGGTGLGLYVSFELVKLHGGQVDVDSKERVGSTFSFTMPIYNGQQIEVQRTSSKNLLEDYKIKAKGEKISDQG